MIQFTTPFPSLTVSSQILFQQKYFPPLTSDGCEMSGEGTPWVSVLHKVSILFYMTFELVFNYVDSFLKNMKKTKEKHTVKLVGVVMIIFPQLQDLKRFLKINTFSKDKCMTLKDRPSPPVMPKLLTTSTTGWCDRWTRQHWHESSTTPRLSSRYNYRPHNSVSSTTRLSSSYDLKSDVQSKTRSYFHNWLFWLHGLFWLHNWLHGVIFTID
jgi:hypothetical protein